MPDTPKYAGNIYYEVLEKLGASMYLNAAISNQADAAVDAVDYLAKHGIFTEVTQESK